MKAFPIEQRWCLHSYYSLCPYAPDGSGRILIAGADLDDMCAELFVLSPDGEILNRFGSIPVTASFWHTALWQSWSPDARYIYYQAGSLKEPFITRHHLESGKEVRIPGDVEGMPPSGEPALACRHGRLYAAGYGGNKFAPEDSPVPFHQRDRHGISRLSFDQPDAELILSTEDILNRHPLRERILAADDVLKQQRGEDDGLTLMTYCLRWNRDGERCLFFFGNHVASRLRNEPNDCAKLAISLSEFARVPEQ